MEWVRVIYLFLGWRDRERKLEYVVKMYLILFIYVYFIYI